MKQTSMKRITTLVSVGVLTLLVATEAQAGPIGRGSIRGYNPATGNSGHAVGGYNSNTGARYYRVGGYNANTGTYQGGSGAYNPVTGRGYNSTSVYDPATGFTGNINTRQNGSYVCTASADSSPNCIKQ